MERWKCAYRIMSWAPTTASTRLSELDTDSLWFKIVWHVDYTITTGPAGVLQVIFHSNPEEKLSASEQEVIILSSSQGEDLKLFIFWVKEPLQPFRVWEICIVIIGKKDLLKKKKREKHLAKNLFPHQGSD